MKFRLISRQGVDEGTGEIPDPFAGNPVALIWAGRTFLFLTIEDEETHIYNEVLGQALDHHQVTPPPKVAERWTSPTAIGRMAEKAPDVVDSVAPGYVQPLRMSTDAERRGLMDEPTFDPTDGPGQPMLGITTVEVPFRPIGDPEGRPSLYMDGGPLPDCDKPDQVSWIIPPRRRRGEPS